MVNRLKYILNFQLFSQKGIIINNNYKLIIKQLLLSIYLKTFKNSIIEIYCLSKYILMTLKTFSKSLSHAQNNWKTV